MDEYNVDCPLLEFAFRGRGRRVLYQFFPSLRSTTFHYFSYFILYLSFRFRYIITDRKSSHPSKGKILIRFVENFKRILEFHKYFDSKDFSVTSGEIQRDYKKKKRSELLFPRSSNRSEKQQFSRVKQRGLFERALDPKGARSLVPRVQRYLIGI